MRVINTPTLGKINMIIKNGDLITAKQARALIEVYGARHVTYNGSWPEDFGSDAIGDLDVFSVIINYDNNVRLLLDDEQGVVDICLANLFGVCEFGASYWCAVVDISE